MAGCIGECCENFTLPFTLEEIKVKALKKEKGNGSIEEYPKLVDMLISTGKISKIFNCKYFNKETKLCMNYKERPIVCKQHPVSVPCAKQNCKEPLTCSAKTPNSLQTRETVQP
jgi:Fe-S-cluster containining protein